jgi:hypothetical protein
MNIHEVLEYGAIVYSDQDVDVLITANGSSLNYWTTTSSGEYECTESRIFEEDLFSLSLADVTSIAQSWFDEVSNGDYIDDDNEFEDISDDEYGADEYDN